MKRFLLIIYLIGVLSHLYAQDRSLQLGGDQGWSQVEITSNLELRPGRRGFLDLYLADQHIQPNQHTDLLINGEGPFVSPRYKPLEDFSPSENQARRGQGSIQFKGKSYAVKLVPQEEALFRSGSLQRDFTIQFWLHPLTLSNNEEILSWRGALRQKGRFLGQKFYVGLENQTLEILLENIFLFPDGTPLEEVRLSGITGLIPNRWSYHVIRYNSDLGMIEYFLNNRLEGVTYTTSDRRESLPLASPVFSPDTKQPLIIGGNFTGFLDELEISTGLGVNNYHRYSPDKGTLITKPLDMKYTNSLLLDIDATHRRDENTDLSYYLKIADEIGFDQQLPGEWQPFDPENFTIQSLTGRFIQIRTDFHTNAQRDNSPRLSSLTIHYQEDTPPAAPIGITALPGNESALLQWKEVAESDIGGYLVYYGDAPGQYWGSSANEGKSPIDVGNVTEIQISGLENDKIYFFSVVAYDQAQPAHESTFSQEVQTRPQRKY